MNNNYRLKILLPSSCIHLLCILILQAKEGGVSILPLFATQRGVGVSTCDYIIDN
jgi:hypothetical protein